MAKKSPKNSSDKSPAVKRGPGRPPSNIEMICRTFYIPKELMEKIEAYAYWNHMSLSAAVTLGMQRFIEKEKPKLVPKGTKTRVSEIYRNALKKSS